MAGAPPLLGFDDANIFLVYARNLAAGEGAVWVPGGERVEGFTSLLWTLLAAGAHRLVGAGSIEAVLLLASVLLTAAPLVLVLRLLPPRGPGGYVALAWLAGLAGYYGWAGITLMDTALWAALLHLFLASLLAVADRRNGAAVAAAVLAGLLVLARPESTLVVPCLLAAAWRAAPDRRPAWIAAGAAWAAAAAGLTAFRVAHFGYPLPNTYYAKVPPDPIYRLGRGAEYVAAYLLEHPMAVAVLAACAWILLAERPRRRGAGRDPAPWLASVLVGVGMASVVLSGGDHFAAHRFVQPFLPAAALPLASAVDRLAPRIGGVRPVLRGAGIAILVGWVAVEWAAFRRHGDFPTGFAITVEGRMMAGTLNRAVAGARTAPTVGVWRAGAIGYAYAGPTLDLLGLNWVAMGHSPGDRVGIRDHAAFHPGVFWTRPPELMLPTPWPIVQATGCPGRIWEDLLRGLIESDRFRRAYEPVVVAGEPGLAVFAFARSDWLDAAPDAVDRLGRQACGWPAAAPARDPTGGPPA